MKKQYTTLRKVTNKIRPDETYYTNITWPVRYIDGKRFVPVVKNIPNGNYPQVTHYMNEEQVKITAVSTVESTRVS